MKFTETTQTDRDIADGKYGNLIVFDRERCFWLNVLDGKGGVASMPELGASLPEAFAKAWDLGHDPTHWAEVGRGGVQPIPSGVLAIGPRRAEAVREDGEAAARKLAEALGADGGGMRIDRPDDPRGEWFLDVGPEGGGVTVAWKHGHGYGLYPVEGEAAYGERPSEVLKDPLACAEGVRLRMSAKGTDVRGP